MRLAHLDLGPRPLLLAPMEDVSDPPFRLLCKRYGADMVYTEFVSAGGIVHEAASSLQKLDVYDEERPVAIQIFGGDEDELRRAVPYLEPAQPDLVDINYGCPVKKVVSHDGGAGVLRNLAKMEALTAAVIEGTTRPVTVKTRLGWNDETINVLDVVRMLERLGVAAVTIHARTRAQMYTGSARWNWLRRIKDEAGLSIPLIGNGDADSPERAKAMFDETGVDGVMIGRGAIGNPWIFRETRHFLDTGEHLPGPKWDERMRTVAEHATLKCEWLGERKGVLEMRRMYGGYFKGFAGAGRLRSLVIQEPTLGGVLERLLNFSQDDLDAAAGEKIAVPVGASTTRAALAFAHLPTPTRKQPA
ncbi:MAG: tRNA dihydrouridine synthase DusB [Bacteroidetes bacterium]|nr:tRNA dihydrouridine synthase DusB [Bacteroidota bacterium]